MFCSLSAVCTPHTCPSPLRSPFMPAAAHPIAEVPSAASTPAPGVGSVGGHIVTALQPKQTQELHKQGLKFNTNLTRAVVYDRTHSLWRMRKKPEGLPLSHTRTSFTKLGCTSLPSNSGLQQG